MNFIKKYAPKAAAVIMIAILILGLFYSIDKHIDGLGIFSIMAGILAFSFYLKGNTNSISNNNDNDHTSVITNTSNIFKVITNPLFIRMLPSLLTVIFSYLEKHKDKLNKAAAEQLHNDIQNTMNSFKSGIEKLEEKITYKNKKPSTPKK